MNPAVDGAVGPGDPLLELSGIVKQFTGTLALDHVDLDVRPGEIHALLGQNGAGKSDADQDPGRDLSAHRGADALEGAGRGAGSSAVPITFIHQDLGLVDTMTVAENVAMLTGYPAAAA